MDGVKIVDKRTGKEVYDAFYERLKTLPMMCPYCSKPLSEHEKRESSIGLDIRICPKATTHLMLVTNGKEFVTVEASMEENK